LLDSEAETPAEGGTDEALLEKPAMRQPGDVTRPAQTRSVVTRFRAQAQFVGGAHPRIGPPGFLNGYGLWPKEVKARRIALYSHGTVGLGHIRRNLLIAQTLAAALPDAVILIVAGTQEAASFPTLPGVDYVALPALRKDETGHYQARRLELTTEQVLSLRTKAIRAALEAFEPDALIVDYVPRGVLRELDPTLQWLRARGKTRCILGLRDVLDDPDAVRIQWARLENEAAIRDYYDVVWVYGDPTVYDLTKECRLSPEVAAKVRFTGYLDPRIRLALASDEHRADLQDRPFVLCNVGGGQDGIRLAEAFLRAELPPGMTGVIVTGPLMPPEAQRRLRRFAKGNPRLRIFDFISEPIALIKSAARVIGMGGYNTACEVLAFEKPALIVPRVKPSAEQMIRAQRLSELGLIDVLHPDLISADAISLWLAGEPRPPRRVRQMLDFGGLHALPGLLEDALNHRSGSWREAAIRQNGVA
jgi:predicted glycosyltransferase